MLKILRLQTPSEDFLKLNNELDEYYFYRFGAIALQYRSYNSIKEVTDFFIAYEGTMPVGIACFRPFEGNCAELKRVFVREPFRRRGISRALVAAAETAANEKGYCAMVLETGTENAEAIGLYQSLGYKKIANFGQFVSDPICLCMKKEF